MNIVFATSERAEAERRLRESNGALSTDTVSRVGALVAAGAIRVGDNQFHAPGSIFRDRVLTVDELIELAAIETQAIAETRAPTKKGTE